MSTETRRQVSAELVRHGEATGFLVPDSGEVLHDGSIRARLAGKIGPIKTAFVAGESYRVGDERVIAGLPHRAVLAGPRRRRRCADELPVGATLKVGWLLWRRSSPNCFIATDLPEARLEIRRHVAWRKRPSPTPWRIANVFGWYSFGEDRAFATPEEAMRRAGELAAKAISRLEARISRARRRGELHLE